MKKNFAFCSVLQVKVIPLFCTAHPLLRITLPHPRWRRFVPPARKEKTAFIRNNNGADRLTASWFAIEKQKNERNALDPKVCSGFSLCGRRVVELLKCPGWGFGLWGAVRPVGQLYGSPTALTSPVSVPGSLLYICCSNSESGETNISGKMRHTVAPEPREGVFDVNTKFTTEFTF